jgi:hypothetical protein
LRVPTVNDCEISQKLLRFLAEKYYSRPTNIAFEVIAPAISGLRSLPFSQFRLPE